MLCVAGQLPFNFWTLCMDICIRTSLFWLQTRLLGSLFFLHSVVCSFTLRGLVNLSRTQTYLIRLQGCVVETYWVQSRQIIPTLLMRLDDHPRNDTILVTHESFDDIPSLSTANTPFTYLLFYYYLSWLLKPSFFLTHTLISAAADL